MTHTRTSIIFDYSSNSLIKWLIFLLVGLYRETFFRSFHRFLISHIYLHILLSFHGICNNIHILISTYYNNRWGARVLALVQLNSFASRTDTIASRATTIYAMLAGEVADLHFSRDKVTSRCTYVRDIVSLYALCVTLQRRPARNTGRHSGSYPILVRTRKSIDPWHSIPLISLSTRNRRLYLSDIYERHVIAISTPIFATSWGARFPDTHPLHGGTTAARSLMKTRCICSDFNDEKNSCVRREAKEITLVACSGSVWISLWAL